MKKTWLVCFSILGCGFLETNNLWGMNEVDQEHATENSARHLTLDQLKAEIRKTEYETNERLSSVVDKTAVRVLLVGVTGSGKSTLLHSLAGIALKGKMIRGFLRLEPDDEELFEIGHDAYSVTSIPNVYGDPVNKIVYFDCPGFLDTTVEQRILNAFAIEQLFSRPCRVKILIVMQESETHAERGGPAKKVLDLVTRLIPKKEELEQSVGIILTQGQSNPFDCLDRLRQTKGGYNPLLDYFLTEGRDKVFAFPGISQKGPYDSFTDRERVIDFFKTAPAVSPEHNIVLDDTAQSWILYLGQSFNKDIREALNALTTEMGKVYRTEVQLTEIQKWIGCIQTLKEASLNGLEAFSSNCRDLLQFSDDFSSFIKVINGFVSWYNFMSTLMQATPELGKLGEFSLDIHEILKPILDGQLSELQGMEDRQKQAEETERMYREEQEKQKQVYEEEQRKIQEAYEAEKLTAAEMKKQLEELQEKQKEIEETANQKYKEAVEQQAASSQQRIEEMRELWLERLQQLDNKCLEIHEEKMRLYKEHAQRMREEEERRASASKVDWDNTARGIGTILGVVQGCIDIAKRNKK